MSEPIVEQQPVDHAAVAQQLQTVVTELRGKNAQRKSRIAELEAAMTAKDSEISQLQSTVRQVTIDGPLRAMAEEISTAPDLWLEQWAKSFKLEMVDGKLRVLAMDGKPSGVAFERDALAKHLTADTFQQSKNFRAITIVSRASGAGGNGIRRRAAETEAPKPTVQFGLR